MENQSVLFGSVEFKTTDEKVIKIKSLPVRAFPTFADALSDEPTLVELFTGLTSDEVDALAMEDFEKILKLGMEINMPPFSRWGKRRREAIKTMTSLLSDEAPDVMSGKNGANTLPNS